jgi:hypothetical protein
MTNPSLVDFFRCADLTFSGRLVVVRQLSILVEELAAHLAAQLMALLGECFPDAGDVLCHAL